MNKFKLFAEKLMALEFRRGVELQNSPGDPISIVIAKSNLRQLADIREIVEEIANDE